VYLVGAHPGDQAGLGVNSVKAPGFAVHRFWSLTGNSCEDQNEIILSFLLIVI